MCQDIGLLLMRLVVAAIFINEGYGKLSDISGTVMFFAHLGLAPWLVYVVGIIEFVGGIAMLLGIFTGYAGIGFVVVLIGVIFTGHVTHGGFFFGHSYEFTLLTASLALALIGPGRFSLPWGRRTCVVHDNEVTRHSHKH